MMNAFATFMLFAWVPISLGVAKRVRPSVAAPVLLLGATMFLPQLTWVKVPGLVEFDKTTVASLWCALGLFVARPALRRRISFRGGFGWFVALAIVSVVGTSLTNGEGFSVGPRRFEGYDSLDLFLGLQSFGLHLIVPFLIGSVVFRTRDEVRDFFVVLAGAGAIYSVPMLVEKVVSPQLHRWIYGEHQHEFLQAMRGGGYRPMVFMYHGLAVALFTVSALIAAITLHRLGIRLRKTAARRVAIYFGFLLVACNSAGALVYGMIATPVLLATRRRIALHLAAAITLFALAYPVFSFVGMVPRDQLVEVARNFGNPERADSLSFRFVNEELCFERGVERPWFGWGSFDRASIVDPDSGRTLSVRDGHWVIVFGESGALGYAAQIGMLAFPVFAAWRRRRRIDGRFDVATLHALALLVGIHVIDLVPNGMFSLLPAFFAGTLHGALRGFDERASAEVAASRIAVGAT